MRSLPTILIVASLTAGSAFAQDAAQPAVPSAANTVAPATAAAATEEQAKAAIEAAGYTNVAGLTKTPQGQWSGTAMKDGKALQLSVNAQGHVAVRNN